MDSTSSPSKSPSPESPSPSPSPESSRPSPSPIPKSGLKSRLDLESGLESSSPDIETSKISRPQGTETETETSGSETEIETSKNRSRDRCRDLQHWQRPTAIIQTPK